MKRGVLLAFLLLACFSFCQASFFGDDKSFDVDNALLKLVLKEGSSSEKLLKITSFEDNDFRIESKGMDFVSLPESEFHLTHDEEKNVIIKFDGRDKEPGIYSGELVILDGKTSKIPVVMEVESQDVLFDSNINVPLEYIDAYAGDNIVFENKIFNLENIGAETIEVSYFVRSFSGKTIFSDQENIVVENQLLNTKVVSLPDDLDEGNYLFGVVIKYRNSVGTSTHFFKVNKKINYSGLGENVLMWAVIGMLIALIFFIVYYTKKRDDVLLELHREYKREIGKTAEAIEKEKEMADKLEGEKKCCALKKIAEKKKHREKMVKKIYVTRVRVVKALRKHKRENEVSKKLRQWKKAGYNVDELLKKDEKSLVSDYKKEGYKL